MSQRHGCARAARNAAILLMAAACVGCASTRSSQESAPLRGGQLVRTTMRCGLDSLRWSQRFVPRGAGSGDCVEVLEYVDLRTE
jgi:hypothetical protein